MKKNILFSVFFLTLNSLLAIDIDPRIDPNLIHNKYGYYFIPKKNQVANPLRKLRNGLVYEEESLNYIKEIYVKGTDIVHAGACFGDMLPFFSILVKENTVWTFEPIQLNHACANLTIMVNHLKNVFLFHAALSDQRKELFMKSEENGRGIGTRAHILEDQTKIEESEKVQCLPLDDVLKENAAPIGLIHLDVEGHEMEALKGSLKTIEKFHPIIILEVWEGRENEIFEFMRELGYKPTKKVDANIVFLYEN